MMGDRSKNYGGGGVFHSKVTLVPQKILSNLAKLPIFGPICQRHSTSVQVYSRTDTRYIFF